MKYLLALIFLTGCAQDCSKPHPWNMFDKCNPNRPGVK
jgi:hypothetical protein